MKRREFVRHMVDYGYELVREGGNHSWWGNPALNQRSAVPRHREISDNLVKKICRDLGIPAPGESDDKGEPSKDLGSRSRTSNPLFKKPGDPPSEPHF